MLLDLQQASLAELLLEPGLRDTAELARLAGISETLIRSRKLNAEAIAKERANAREQLREEQRRKLAEAVDAGELEAEAMRRAMRAMGLDRKSAPEPQP